MDKHQIRYSITLFLTLLLVLSPVLSGVFSMESSMRGEVPEENIQDKISLEIQEQLDQEGYIEVLVKLNQQVDTEKISHNAFKIAPSQAAIQQQRVFVRNSVIEALKNTARNQQKGLLQYLQAETDRGKVQEIQGYYIVNMIYVKAVPEVIKKISYRPEVKVVLPNEKVPLVLPQGEEIHPESSAVVQWNVERVRASHVWEDFNVDGSGVVIGMIDTGIEWQHEALKDKWRGFNPCEPDNPDPIFNWFDAVHGTEMPSDISKLPHGTHVMGTVLGSTADFFIGIAPGAKWIAANAFKVQEDGKISASASDILLAAQYMLAPTDAEGIEHPEKAPDIINNSWGGSPVFNEWFRPMVQSWRAAQIFPVFAAGNSGPGAGTIANPANYPENIAVGAVDYNNTIASFSARGPGHYEDVIKPDISAPGVNILSSVPGGYSAWNGTSMAAPHAAGVAALMLSADPSLTVDKIEEIIKETASPLTDGNYTQSPNYAYGYGLVNAYEAVKVSREEELRISGQVLVPLVDNEPPVIVHNPLQYSYAGLNLPVYVEVSDNVSVSQVDVLFQKPDTMEWVSIELERVEGDYKQGTYSGIVPWHFLNEPIFEYKIVSQDFSGNHAKTPLYTLDIYHGLQAGHSEDFNDYPYGWHFFNEWEWGKPSVGPVSIYGENQVGTNLNGNYSNNSVSYLLSPPLDLRNMENPLIQLTHWYDLEHYYDEGVIWVTGDYGQNWEALYYFTGRDCTWRNLYFTLDDYIGFNQVFLCFALYSDDTNNYTGWYIDRFVYEEEEEVVTCLETFEGEPEESTNYEENEVLDKQPPPPREIHIKIQDTEECSGCKVYSFNEDSPQGLPADARITVVETGVSVQTDPADGIFRMVHPPSLPGEFWTLRVEAEYYKTIEVAVELTDEEGLSLNFLLEINYDDLLLGDVNGDENVDVGDVILLLRDIVGITDVLGQHGQQAFLKGDVNGDGTLDVGDAILILRYIVNLIEHFPVEE